MNSVLQHAIQRNEFRSTTRQPGGMNPLPAAAAGQEKADEEVVLRTDMEVLTSEHGGLAQKSARFGTAHRDFCREGPDQVAYSHRLMLLSDATSIESYRSPCRDVNKNRRLRSSIVRSERSSAGG